MYLTPPTPPPPPPHTHTPHPEEGVLPMFRKIWVGVFGAHLATLTQIQTTICYFINPILDNTSESTHQFRPSKSSKITMLTRFKIYKKLNSSKGRDECVNNVNFKTRLKGYQTKNKTNRLYLTRVTLNSEITDKPVALGFQIELEFGNVGF